MNWAIPSFEIGYWVRTSKARNGYILEAVNAVARYAFEQLKAKRLEIKCDADNHRSIQVAERLGFQLEGRLRKNEFKCDGQSLRDTLIFSRMDTLDLPELKVTWDSQN